MRRRLVVLMVVTTVLIIAAFVVPLTLVLRSAERSDEIQAGTAQAHALAAVITSETPVDRINGVVSSVEDETPGVEVTVYSEEGVVAGTGAPTDASVGRALSGQDVQVAVDGGVAIYVPDTGPFGDEPAYAIRLFIPRSVLNSDLPRLYITLFFSIGATIAIAAVIGVLAARSISEPTRRLTRTARRMHDGDLDVEAPVEGPEELRELAETLNTLSRRIGDLLAGERESTADLAHQLRTPLTSLHLDVEALPDGERRDQLLGRVRHLERTLDLIIGEMRHPTDDEQAVADLVAVLNERSPDWAAVAADGGRTLDLHLSLKEARVPVRKSDLEAAFDALANNEVTHTPAGTEIRVSLRERDTDVVLSVEDDGPGFPEGDVLSRGVSVGTSTGLGLDIVRRTVERAGGSIDLGTSEVGGARIVLTFPRLEN